MVEIGLICRHWSAAEESNKASIKVVITGMIMRYEAYFIYCFILYAFALLDYQEYKCEACKPGFYVLYQRDLQRDCKTKASLSLK